METIFSTEMPTGIYERTKKIIFSKEARKNISLAVTKRWENGENLLEKAHIAFQKKCLENRVSVRCVMCNKIEKVPQCRSKRKYCSMKCYGLSKVGKPWQPDMSLFLPKGDKHYNWKGGIKTRWPSKEEIKWRNEIFERDNYTCQECNERGCYLEAHHIKRKVDFPDLKNDIKNGITLCKKCHLLTYCKEEKFENKYIDIINKTIQYAI